MDLALDRTRRKRNVADLCDTVRICTLIGFVVALGLPWWVQTDPQFTRVGSYTGLASLGAGSGSEGYAWWGFIAAAFGLVTFPFRRTWVSLSGAVITILAAAAMVVTALNGLIAKQGSIADGTWIAFLLLLIMAVAGITQALASAPSSRYPED